MFFVINNNNAIKIMIISNNNNKFPMYFNGSNDRHTDQIFFNDIITVKLNFPRRINQRIALANDFFLNIFATKIFITTINYSYEKEMTIQIEVSNDNKPNSFHYDYNV